MQTKTKKRSAYPNICCCLFIQAFYFTWKVTNTPSINLPGIHGRPSCSHFRKNLNCYNKLVLHSLGINMLSTYLTFLGIEHWLAISTQIWCWSLILYSLATTRQVIYLQYAIHVHYITCWACHTCWVLPVKKINLIMLCDKQLNQKNILGRI